MLIDEPVLKVTGLRKLYPGVRALDGVDLQLRSGRIHALLGENGAGKSTLVKIVTGNETATTGTIAVDGEPVHWRSPRTALAAGVRAVFQELTVLPELSVQDNVLLGMQPARRGLLARRDARAQALGAMQGVGLDGIDPRTRAGDLSLANQQLIEIARALVREARIVVLDEPSAVLSGDKLDVLYDAVRALARRGAAVVYITHRLDEVFELADDVTVMRDGRTVSTGEVGEYDVRRIIRDMVGRDVDTVFPDVAAPSDAARLEISGVEIDAVRTKVTVRAGEILGIAGLVGSGRSRFLRAIANWQAHRDWHVTVDGSPTGASIRSAIDSGIAFVSEDRARDGVVLTMPVAANTTLATLREISSFGVISRRRERACYQTERDRLQIKATSTQQPVGELSGGNQQKVVLGKWLRTDPKVLLLDEPTRGIDVGTKTEIYQIIAALAREGLAVVLVSSELPEVMNLAHRVLVCRQGQFVAIRDRSELDDKLVMELAVGSGAS